VAALGGEQARSFDYIVSTMQRASPSKTLALAPEKSIFPIVVPSVAQNCQTPSGRKRLKLEAVL